MKRSAIILLALVGTLLAACNDYETYGDQKKKERKAISKFIADSAFTIISETQFEAQGRTTDLARKEFVHLEKSDVYMQIERVGCGEMVKDGESLNILCRFVELNIEDTTVVYNDRHYPYDVDKMYVTRTGSSYTATFVEGNMLQQYGQSVPPGWLVPLNYVKVGRLSSADDELARVRLIVPHSQGHQTATSYVYPYYYEITYERGR